MGMNHRRPGRLRFKLAEMLSVALERYIDPSDIWEQSGAYRTDKRHEALVWGVGIEIGSWDSMTDCTRYGFDVTRGGFGNRSTSSGVRIQIDAKSAPAAVLQTGKH